MHNVIISTVTNVAGHTCHIIYMYYIVYCVRIWLKSTYNVQGGSPSMLTPIFPLIMNLLKFKFFEFSSTTP